MERTNGLRDLLGTKLVTSSLRSFRDGDVYFRNKQKEKKYENM
jgi:hypothetical protein